ncbi:hypothetical protein GCM10010495_41530 [Kitasatospora herbaricolor]|uniref:hypothetical protein n=1 Tax=Kitasatospora herbaricolor TaxID=68217 RepID=UPI00174E2A14|nr:hypothetical protein [Kitasatospora herbaricolor]MDQ0310314.1 hypothetical protein [Kitasatospora herbaricolor]GGV21615.1 hypothetical protein GCM10010495_41530 [Kitasatospora herbaricolor]
MPEPTPLTEAVDRLADRFRAMPQSRLLAAVPGHLSRAAAGLALARTLAAVAQALEGLQPRPFPDAGAFAAGDQLAVAGHDLAAALAAGEPVAGLATRSVPVVLPVPLGALPAGAPADGAAVLAEALAAVAATTELCA